MERIKLLFFHLSTICDLPNYPKIIKEQASTERLVVAKKNIEATTNHFDRRGKKFESSPRYDCKMKTFRK